MTIDVCTVKAGLVPQGAKAPYTPPVLRYYGAVAQFTQGGSGTVGDGAGMNMLPSDRAVKENIVQIGAHPLGLGLYLFDYKTQYRKPGRNVRNFGVMADEVESVLPEAVEMHANGYKMVNYAMLGMTMPEPRFN